MPFDDRPEDARTSTRMDARPSEPRGGAGRPTPCRQCVRTARYVAAGEERAVTCGDCGCEVRAKGGDAAQSGVYCARLHSRAREPVAQLLLDLAVVRVYQCRLETYMARPSALASYIDTHVIGDGCSGTKGAMARGGEPRLGVPRRPAQADQLDALAPLPGGATRAWLLAHVLLDGSVPDLHHGKRDVPLTVAQALGFARASDKQRERWLKLVAKKDARPALESAERMGEALLEVAAEEWAL